MDSTIEAVKTERCPGCNKNPRVWYEQAAFGSRALYWVGCKNDGHLVGGIKRMAGVTMWNRYVAHWKWQKGKAS
jgi:hypothetical protein